MFNSLIVSNIRIKTLMRLFINLERYVYLRELTDEFQTSLSNIKKKLKQFKKLTSNLDQSPQVCTLAVREEAVL